jgi:5-methylcytosine-specific restriction protein B
MFHIAYSKSYCTIHSRIIIYFKYHIKNERLNMARRSENETIYKIFHNFIEQCLLGDKSLLWPNENFWTLNNLMSVKRNMIDSPILGTEYTFEEKLEKQMSSSSRAEWGIIRDTYFIYFLPSVFMTYDKKMRDISWAAKKGGLSLPSPQDQIWQAQKHGFTNTGFKYPVNNIAKSDINLHIQRHCIYFCREPDS